MDGNVRRIGDQFARSVEQGAGEIEPFLDVYRSRRRLENDAHLFCDRHEEIVENFEPDRVHLGPRRTVALKRFAACEYEAAFFREPGLPSAFDDCRRCRIDHQNRTLHDVACVHRRAFYGLPCARGLAAGGNRLGHCTAEAATHPAGLDAQSLDHDRRVVIGIAEPPAVEGAERPVHRSDIAAIDRQQAVTAFEPQAGVAFEHDLAVFDTLIQQGPARLSLEVR